MVWVTFTIIFRFYATGILLVCKRVRDRDIYMDKVIKVSLQVRVRVKFRDGVRVSVRDSVIVRHMVSGSVRVLVNVRDSDLVRVSKIYRTVKVQVMVNFAFDDMFGSRFTIRVKVGVRGACGVKVGTEKDLRLVLVQNFMFRYGWALGRMLLVFGYEFLINENTGTFFLKYNKRKDEARQTDGHIALSECGPKNQTQTATEHFEEAKETIPQYWFASGLGIFQYGLEFV